MIKLDILVILILLGFNLKSQERGKNISQFKLTTLSEKILDMFIDDPMNIRRIDSLSCSIVLSFGDIHDLNNELWIYDAELLHSCVKNTYLTKYKGFNIFYDGKMLSKFIYKCSYAKEVKCTACDSLLKAIPKDEQVPFDNYDGSIYKIKKGTTIKNIMLERVQGG